MERKFAAQLYTLREELKEGIKPLFKTLKDMGWAGVQLSALPAGYDPKEVAEALKETGLGVAGMHVSLERLQTDLQGIMDEVDLYGTKDIICPAVPYNMHNKEGFEELKRTLNEVADKAPNHRISYHNHAFEFDIDINGQEGLEYVLDPADGNKVHAEIDVYWVKKGGFDPVAYIKPYANRMPIIHLKDMTDDERQTFAEVGEGVIDFEPILRWGEESGVEWYAVEQDVCERPPLESLELSLTNLKALAKKIEGEG